MNEIQFSQVSKYFGSNRALEQISFSLEQGKIYGLLGRNGAGKSTLLNLLTGRLFPSEGEITVDGEPAAENDRAQEKIFLMSEQTLFPAGMTTEKAFAWCQMIYPQFDPGYAESLAKQFGLRPNGKVKSFSTGYTSIFKLILGLASNTPYLLLDEPVLGLDANHRDLFYRLLLENYQNTGRTILVSTHLIEEIAKLVEHVLIIKNGKLICNRPCEELLSDYCVISGPAQQVDQALAGSEIIGIETVGPLKAAWVYGRIEHLPQGLMEGPADLQKLFIHLTNA